MILPSKKILLTGLLFISFSGKSAPIPAWTGKFPAPDYVRYLDGQFLFNGIDSTVPGTTTNSLIKNADWERLTADKAFDYKNDVERAPQPVTFQPNLLQKMVNAVLSFFNTRVGGLLVWLVLISIAGFVIYRLFMANDSFLFRKSKKMNQVKETEADDHDITSTNWEGLLQNATDNKDLRLAIRYAYMWLLQLLQQKELIHYRIDKTNYEYLTELARTEYKQQFGRMCRQYEYSWYGRSAITERAFSEYITLFYQLRKQIGS